MKKLTAFLLAALLLAALSACAKRTETETTAAQTETQTQTLSSETVSQTETTAPAGEPVSDAGQTQEADAGQDAAAGQEDAQETRPDVPTEPVRELVPGSYDPVSYGRITCITPPEGWRISDESAYWCIVYVQGPDVAWGAPTLQITAEDASPEALFQQAVERCRQKGETYTTAEYTIAGIRFTAVAPDPGTPSMYGSVDGRTLMVTYTRDVDLYSQAVTDILGNVHIAS